ncbi:hypothetical protein [Jannaschia sp. 2305UL9-9]|uniref:hypothetical protein n=1 Tax=Jannaschia sp. 2305UL9-9 TaxID=3121638 RepID=UPI0035270EC2
MLRPLAAAALSLTLALPMATTPAQAQIEGRHAAQILGGLAALYVLKEALDRREERQATPVQRAPTYRAPVARHPQRGAPARGGHNAKRIPQQCANTFRTANGRVTGYGARCMQNNVARPGALPPRCIRQVRTDRGTRNIYADRCLQREGWTMARR